jgi:subtilisin family serine protease
MRARGKQFFVIDSGASDQTGDLNLNTELSRDWIPGKSLLSDKLGHGTHIAGTIAATNNQIGISGAAPGAEVISLKGISNINEAAPFSSHIESIDYALSIINKQKLDLDKVVINMSPGAPASTQEAITSFRSCLEHPWQQPMLPELSSSGAWASIRSSIPQPQAALVRFNNPFLQA